MKKFVLVSTVILLVASLFYGCKKKNSDSPEPTVISQTVTAGQNASISLSNIATVSFEENSFPSDVVVTLSKVTEVNENDFDVTGQLYKVNGASSYEVHINTSAVQPDKYVNVILHIPEDLRDKINNEYGIQILGQLYYDDGDEVLDGFEIIPSRYIESANTVEIELPYYYFTNKRNSDQTFEAILRLATTYGAHVGEGKSASVDCAGQYLSCPVFSCAESVIKSRYGVRTDPITGKKNAPHQGTDLAVQSGTPVKAMADGQVVQILHNHRNKNNPNKGYGNVLTIEHMNGTQRFSTAYAHLSEFKVALGDNVTEGQVIALSGQTGGVTGPHLHVEYFLGEDIRRASGREDFTEYINTTSLRLRSATATTGAVNSCEFNNDEMGTPWDVTLQFENPSNQNLNGATLTFQDQHGLQPAYSVPYSGNYTIQDPSFCARFVDYSAFKMKVFMTLSNNSTSNCIYFYIFRPTGANKYSKSSNQRVVASPIKQ